MQQATDQKKTADTYGLEFLQAHAPYGHRRDDEEAVARVIPAIEICGVVGAPVLMVHSCFLPERIMVEQQKYFDINVGYYSRLRPHAEAVGVTQAIENNFVWNEKENELFSSCFLRLPKCRPCCGRGTVPLRCAWTPAIPI